MGAWWADAVVYLLNDRWPYHWKISQIWVTISTPKPALQAGHEKFADGVPGVHADFRSTGQVIRCVVYAEWWASPFFKAYLF